MNENRKTKGQQNRTRIAEVRQQKADGTYRLPDKDQTTSGGRVPTNQKEMQAHLSGRYPDEFRDPITRRERRAWDKFWKEKGPGVTKPEKKGERFK